MTEEGSEAGGPEQVKRAPLPDWWWRQSLGRRQLIAGVVFGSVCLIIGLLLFTLLSGGGVGRYAEAYEFVDSLPPETVDTWDALAECETNSEWSKNTGNGFYGGLQFQQSSWLEVGGEGLASETPREEQIFRADKLRQKQGWQAWPNCAAQLGLV